MGDERLEMLGRAEAAGLARLGGDVADVDAEPGCGGDRVADVADQQVREDAAEQAARARSTIMSASRMRSIASGLARTSAGSMKTCPIGSSVAAIATWPLTWRAVHEPRATG